MLYISGGAVKMTNQGDGMVTIATAVPDSSYILAVNLSSDSINSTSHMLSPPLPSSIDSSVSSTFLTDMRIISSALFFCSLTYYF